MLFTLCSFHRASYRDSAFLWGDHDPNVATGNGLVPAHKPFKTTNATISEEYSKSDVKPLLGEYRFVNFAMT